VSTGAPELLEDAGAPPAAGGEGAAEIAARSPLQLFWRRLRRDKVALFALGIVVVTIMIAIFAPLVVKILGAPDPNVQNDDLLGDFGEPTGPTAEN
jgi:peptide/nickel transport system permease protein